jgi:tRNA-specific 2-thiouridylase
MSNPQRVVVAMSGGVDSSVVAALLVKQGYQVIGMMMRLWSEAGREAYNRCCTPDAMAGARRVAAILDIPFYAVDAQQIFRERVVSAFMDGYLAGETPNPCLTCNRYIRWEFLLERARALGALGMATGHYARVRQNEAGDYQLLRAVDAAKDQSYVLHVLDQGKLSQALFPLGQFTKDEVRQMARDFGLPVAERADSQDLCFVGDGDYREFLKRNAPQVINPGPIETTSGDQVGEHQGLAFYTIGQRKGLGISASQPYYVLRKDPRENTLIVGFKDELGHNQLFTDRVNWVSGRAPQEPFQGQVKIRYKAHDTDATITPLTDGGVEVNFSEPLPDITHGQAAVIYENDICLGGGIIRTRGKP